MVLENIVETSARLYFLEDFDEITGKPTFTTKNLSNVKADAQSATLLSAVNALASLQQKELHSVERRNVSELRAE